MAESIKIEDFVTLNGVSITAEKTNSNPRLILASRHVGLTFKHWKVVIKRRRVTRSTFTVYFSRLPTTASEPTAAEVLDTLAVDALQAEKPCSDAEMTNEMEIAGESLTKYRELCRKRAAGLKRVLGIGPYNTLLFGTQRILTGG